MYYVKITSGQSVTYDTNEGKYFVSFYSCQRICSDIEKCKDGKKCELMVK